MAAVVEFNSYPTLVLPKSWRLLAISYNVADKPPSRPVVDRICRTVENANFSFVAISLQEIRTSERLGMKMNQTWREQFYAALWDYGFLSVCSSYMMTNLLMVFAKTTMCPAIDECIFSYSKDLYNGAKGTIAVVIKMRADVSLMFVGSHFAHDATKLKFRINEAKCVRKLVHKAKQQHDVRAVCWMGDLNFRSVGIDAATVVEGLKKKKPTEFLSKLSQEHDQLHTTAMLDSAFHGFKEAPITFKPTYRMLIGTSDYDLLRVPSWTDRILIDNLRSLRYDSLPDCTYSDHQPVFSELQFESGVQITNSWSVRFETVNRWYLEVPFRINFDGGTFWKERGSYRDWLGVYGVPHVNERCVITFTNIMLCVDFGTHYMAEFTALPAGNYVVAYHSYNGGCIQGLSNVFTVADLTC